MSTRREPDAVEPRVRAAGHRHLGPPDQRPGRKLQARRSEQRQAWVARSSSAGFTRRVGRGR